MWNIWREWNNRIFEGEECSIIKFNCIFFLSLFEWRTSLSGLAMPSVFRFLRLYWSPNVCLNSELVRNQIHLHGQKNKYCLLLTWGKRGYHVLVVLCSWSHLVCDFCLCLRTRLTLIWFSEFFLVRSLLAL